MTIYSRLGLLGLKKITAQMVKCDRGAASYNSKYCGFGSTSHECLDGLYAHIDITGFLPRTPGLCHAEVLQAYSDDDMSVFGR